MGISSYYIRLKRNKEAESYNLFECDFCALSFHSKSERMCHIANHFENKKCDNCCENLLRIGDNWYSRHDCDEAAVEWTSEDERVMKQFVQMVDDDSFDAATSDDSSSRNYEKLIDSASDTENDGNSFGKKPQTKSEILLTNIDSKYNQKIKAIPTLLEKHMSQKAENVTKKREKCIKKVPTIAKFPKNHRSKPKAKHATNMEQQTHVTCDICNKSLLNLGTLRQHMKVVHDPTTKKKRREIFTCTICNRSLVSKESLLVHLGTHTGTKRFFCDFCGHGFNQMGQMKQHLNIHTGNKPFKCKLCDRGFSHRAQIAVHMRTHTGARPCKCPIDNCDRAFTTSTALKRHKYQAHGILTERHDCSICSKIFAERKSYTRHMKSHNLVKV